MLAALVPPLPFHPSRWLCETGRWLYWLCCKSIFFFASESQSVNPAENALFFPLDLLSSLLQPTLVRLTSLGSIACLSPFPSGFRLGLSNGRHQQELGRCEGRHVGSLSSLAPFLLQLICSDWIPVPKATVSCWMALPTISALNASTHVFPGTFNLMGGNCILLLLGRSFTISCWLSLTLLTLL